MPDTDSYSREKERLEEIVLQTRAKDVPLEKCLDLYDEALGIGTRCVEQLEKTDFTSEELDSIAEHPEVDLSGRVTEHPEGASDGAFEGEHDEGFDEEPDEELDEEPDEDLEEDDEEYSEEEFSSEMDD